MNRKLAGRLENLFFYLERVKSRFDPFSVPGIRLTLTDMGDTLKRLDICDTLQIIYRISRATTGGGFENWRIPAKSCYL